MYPYNILNVQKDATIEEIDAAYRTLRAKYAEDRFLEGEAGRQGALNLESLEAAYSEIKRIRQSSKDNGSGFADDLADVDAMIKAGNLDGAQEALNAAGKRTDRWHFLQSIIYYKKGWYDDSRTQLKLAVTLSPGNGQYTEALNRLENVMASNNSNPHNMGVPPQGGPNSGQNVPPQPDNAMGLMNCCTTLCIMDCCCNMLRCC